MSSDDQQPSGPTPRATGVSLFRPGKGLPNRHVTLDQKTGREIVLSPLRLAAPNPARVWESIGQITLEDGRLAGNGLFTQTAQNPAAATFDILRTRILQALAAKGWGRIAVTSPTHGCGKSFVAANLALSMARMPSCRTVLMDLELRDPQLAALFGVREPQPLREFLLGDQPLESHFRRVGRNLALALNGEAVPNTAALLQDPETTRSLEAMRDQLQPDVVIYDLPPALGSDDVIGLAGQVDAVLLVTDGTKTSPADIRACEQLLDGRLPLLGVVLNRAQDRGTQRYSYGKR
jgi:protein-tyrosine kinase